MRIAASLTATPPAAPGGSNAPVVGERAASERADLPDEERRSRDAERRLNVGLVSGGAILLVLVLAGQMYVWINLWPLRIDVPTAVLWSLPQALLWSLTIPAIDVLATRAPIRGRWAAWVAAGHVAASVACALLVLLCLEVSDRLLGWTRLLGAPGSLVSALDKTILHVHIGIAIYWVVLAANHARSYYRRLGERELRASRLEVHLAEARLATLRTQLEPHFLFNTLNSIGVLMQRDVRGATEMLGRLSEFLRATLSHAGQPEVALHTELEHVRAYLDIERIRFDGRLTATVSAAAGTMDGAVPHLILQPLVENALRHGLSKRSAPGMVAVEAHLDGDRLRLVVRDDGVGLRGWSESRRAGVGLTNVVRRLAHAYGADHRFELHDVATGGVEAVITIPYRPLRDTPGA
jgi:two-component system, LytTR family, sensor kinase